MTRDLPETSSHRGRRSLAPAAPAALAAILLFFALVVLTPPAARAQQPGVRTENGLVYFNLQNVDIRSALESISEVLGISYVLGGSVPTGTPITINTAGGIAIEKVPDLLDSVLRTYNLALIRTGDVFTVVQAGEPGATPPAEQQHTQVYVYYLRNANAVDLANVLNTLFQGGVPPGGFTRRSAAQGALSSALENQQLPYATPRAAPIQQQTPETQPQQPGVVTRIIPGELVGQTAIVPDETTNSLIIRTAPENYPSIEETITKLDVRPLQVLIEVTIAEITLDKSSQFGIEYLLRGKTKVGGETVKGELELQNTTPFAGGLRAHVFDLGNVDATFRALAADSRVNVLSTPRILAVNNHEARILIGSEVPFVQFSRATTGEAIDQVVQYRNVGLELTVTPRINPDRYISMDLLQQVSALSADVLFDAPIITTREAQTSLVVGDQQTVVLGGLMEDRREKRKNGIPVLKDIPILGYIFGSRSSRNVKTELVITLTPYIVGSDLELQSLRKEIETHTHLYQPELERRRERGEFVPGALQPEREVPPAAPPSGPGQVPSGAEAPTAPAPAPPPAPTPAPSDTAHVPRADSLRGPESKTMPQTGRAPAGAAAPVPAAAAPAEEGQEAPAVGKLKVSISGGTLLPSPRPPEPSSPPPGADEEPAPEEMPTIATAPTPAEAAPEETPAIATAPAPAEAAPEEHEARPQPAAAPTSLERALLGASRTSPTSRLVRSGDVARVESERPKATTEAPLPDASSGTTGEAPTQGPVSSAPMETASSGNADAAAGVVRERTASETTSPATTLGPSGASPEQVQAAAVPPGGTPAGEGPASFGGDSPSVSRAMSAGVPPRMDATSQAEPSTTAEEPSTAVEPSSSAARGFRVQVMAIPDSDVAQAEAQRLRALVAPTPVYVEFVSPFYKVRIGDFAARADAEQALERIRQAGYRDAWLVRAAIQASSPVQ